MQCDVNVTSPILIFAISFISNNQCDRQIWNLEMRAYIAEEVLEGEYVVHIQAAYISYDVIFPRNK